MKKFALNAVATAALGFAASGAYATVNIDAATPAPALFASEIVATAGSPVTLTNAGSVLDILSKTDYALANGEVRYVRVELTNAKFAASVTVGKSNANTSLGPVNGGGTQVLYFSLTAGIGGAAATDTLTIPSDLTITGTASNVVVSFSLYDQPSQAQAGGATGRIVNKSATLISFVSGYQVAVTTDTAIADVQASPSFTKFASGQTSGSTTKARLAALDFKLATNVPNKINGTAIALADLFATGASGTKLTVTGDFTAAADATDGTYTTAAATNSVYLSVNTNCNTVDVAASSLSATAVSFNVGATATTANPNLCYVPNTANGAKPLIAAATYTAALNAVAASAAYAPVSLSKGTVSTVTRNGTELQAPLYQVPGGYLSRFALTNTGTVDGTYTATVRAETGNTVTPNVVTGTIPAGKQIIINGGDLATFSGTQRGFVVFTVNRPTAEIQGVFQLTNINSGAVTNTVLVRPGTN